MVTIHNLGFPRIGSKRELKWALEKYWKEETNQSDLEVEGQRIKEENWQQQINANHDFLSVGDFSWYDHVLDTSTLLGVIPDRFLAKKEFDLDTYFRMARGRAPSGADTRASEMTKWFDTNYHYIVPELNADQDFRIYCTKLFDEIVAAQKFGKKIKPILLGPLSYLWLGKAKQLDFDKLALLPQLTSIYQEILVKIRNLGIEWVQIDEPILVLDLPINWQQAFQKTYHSLQIDKLKILLATYFGGLGSNIELTCSLPIAGLHIDLVRAPSQLDYVLKLLSEEKILSLGVVDGRNIWRTDLRKTLHTLKTAQQILKDRLWIAPSCSLLHCPVDLNSEIALDNELKSWLSFAVQKLHEVSLLGSALNHGEASILPALVGNDLAVESRKKSSRIHRTEVKDRCNKITPGMITRQNNYAIRKKIQKAVLNLPSFPTTTIGSFPQTQTIRKIRQDYKSGKITAEAYRQQIYSHIELAISKQHNLGIDVLVHGEAERNDMVEYFGELLEGFAITQNGWVQSYGSRCVKPPIIFGDVSRASPMTVDWTTYAQSLTKKPVKGMLTGPNTILCWSFVRDDQSRFETAKQIAFALRDEVNDLVTAGIRIIQIDEPAIREGLPLRENAWSDYLRQAVYCFRLASCGVPDDIQIHTHMCYSEFNDIIAAIADLDADVITIETSRSDMELLKAFETFRYPNDIGPGVYDIHSPRVPVVEEIINLIEKAERLIPAQQIWINPDCGLKTRDWSETELALQNMVTAAKRLREKYKAFN